MVNLLEDLDRTRALGDIMRFSFWNTECDMAKALLETWGGLGLRVPLSSYCETYYFMGIAYNYVTFYMEIVCTFLPAFFSFTSTVSNSQNLIENHLIKIKVYRLTL